VSQSVDQHDLIRNADFVRIVALGIGHGSHALPALQHISKEST
jgi:hypothetical protein